MFCKICGKPCAPIFDKCFDHRKKPKIKQVQKTIITKKFKILVTY